MRKRRLAFGAGVGAAALVAAMSAAANAAPTPSTTDTGLAALPISAPQVPGLITSHRTAATDCVLPDGSNVSFFHCYTPQQIRAAYGVDAVPTMGKGQTIVLVDSYGSPTAAADLRHFHDTFFAGLPAPSFEQIFPQGNPQFGNTCQSNGMSGPCAAANWSGEATLDIEWAYSIAPLAHIVLLAVPPAETEGVQGFPNLFKAISGEIDATPPGTVFSMSFGVTEQTFGGAAAVQTAKFDQVFQAGLAKHDNFFTSSGDYGSLGFSKQQKDTGTYPYPTASWPASSAVRRFGRRHPAAVRLDMEPVQQRPVHLHRRLQPGVLGVGQRRQQPGGLERVVGTDRHRRRCQRYLSPAVLAAGRGPRLR